LRWRWIQTQIIRGGDGQEGGDGHRGADKEREEEMDNEAEMIKEEKMNSKEEMKMKEFQEGLVTCPDLPSLVLIILSHILILLFY